MAVLGNPSIRAATHADIPALVDLFLRLKRVSPYATIPYSLDDARAAMRRCISSPGGYLALSESGGKVVAALMGETYPFWWSRRHYAADLAFYSTRRGAGEALVEDFCRWAWSRPNVVEVLMGQSSGKRTAATQRMFTRMGFEVAGGIYRMNRYEAMRGVA
jgi:hypothetical protein